MAMRLDRIIAHCGYGTRKEVKLLIRKGHVQVNGVIIKKDDYKVNQDKDLVSVDGTILDYREFVYLMLNKPKGYVCATVDKVNPTVLDLIHDFKHYELFPVGRLDKDTTGLLIISNDGTFSHHLLAPSNNHIKQYEAIVDGIVDDNIIEKFKLGVTIDTGYTCKPANLVVKEIGFDFTKVLVEISEGKFHQIKKMFKAYDLNVIELNRIKIKDLELDPNLSLGMYRELTNLEVESLKEGLI